MATVSCIYCKEKFDKTKIAYIQIPAGKTFRHAHADCYLREKTKTPNLENYEIIDPNNFVKCVYCKETIDKTKDEYQLINNSKYAHKKCIELESKREKTDAEKLDEYIMKLFEVNYVPPMIKKQINQYINEYNYTHSGILKSLQYFYEIKGNQIDPAYSNSIGIVPYIYQNAYQYFYSLWLAKTRNDDKNIDEYIPKVIVIHAPAPTCKLRKRKRFGFLDEEE
jgi:hypothetical protein